MKLLAYLLLVTGMIPALAETSFVANRKDWSGLGLDDQTAYVAGLADSLSGEETNRPLAKAISRCMLQQELTTAMLRDAISARYARHPRDAGRPPVVLLRRILLEVCQSQ